MKDLSKDSFIIKAPFQILCLDLFSPFTKEIIKIKEYCYTKSSMPGRIVFCSTAKNLCFQSSMPGRPGSPAEVFHVLLRFQHRDGRSGGGLGNRKEKIPTVVRQPIPGGTRSGDRETAGGKRLRDQEDAANVAANAGKVGRVGEIVYRSCIPLGQLHFFF